MYESTTTETDPWDFSTAAVPPAQPTRKPRRWLVPVIATGLVAVGTGIGLLVTHDSGMNLADKMANAKVAAAYDYHNPDTLAEDVAKSYDDDDNTTATCIQHGDRNTFVCALTWDYDDGTQGHTTHTVVVNAKGDDWISIKNPS